MNRIIAAFKGSPSLHYMVSQALQRLTPIIVMVVFGAQKGIAASGLYGLIYGAVSLLSVVASLNLNAYIQRISPKPPEERRDSARLAFASTLGSAIVALLAGLALLSPQLHQGLEAFLKADFTAGDIIMSLLAVPALTLNLSILAHLRGRQASVEFLLVTSCQGIIPLGVLAAALAFSWPLPTAISALILFSGICGCIPTKSWLEAGRLHEWRRWDLGLNREVLAFALPLVPHVLLTRFNSQIDKWMLVPLGMSAVGIYSVVFLGAQTIAIVQQSVTDSWYGVWMKMQPEEALHPAIRKGDAALGWAGAAFGSVVLAGLAALGPLIKLPWTLEVAAASAILLAAFVLNGQSMLLFLEAARKMKTTTILVSGLSFIAANILLLLVLISPFKIVGAASAFLLATAIKAAAAGLRLFTLGEMAGLLGRAFGAALVTGAAWMALGCIPLVVSRWPGRILAAAALCALAAVCAQMTRRCLGEVRAAFKALVPAEAPVEAEPNPALEQA